MRGLSEFEVPDKLLSVQTETATSSSEYYDLTTESDIENSRDLFILILIILLLLMLIYGLRRYIFKDTTTSSNKNIKKRTIKKNLSMISSGTTFVRSVFSKRFSASSSRSKQAKRKFKSKVKSQRKRPVIKRKKTISKVSQKIVSERNSTDVNSGQLKTAT